MNWFYVNHQGQQAGPITDAELKAATESGVIHGETLVWNDGMTDWVKYSTLVRPGVPSAPAGGISPTEARCSECGGIFQKSDMVDFSGAWVCANCKPQYVQKLREGVPTGAAGSCWRDGKVMVTPVENSLPHRCIKCNDAVSGAQVERKFYWHHPAIYLALILRVVPYLILYFIFRKRATLMISVCDRHRKARTMAIIISWLLVFGAVAAVTLAIMYSSAPLGIAGAVIFLGAIFYAVIKTKYLVPVKIDKTYARMKGCCPAFLAELPEWTGPK